MSFASIVLPVAAPRWRLDGPAGPHTDAIVAGLVGAGVTVECITGGTAYRLDGPAELLDVLAGELAPIEGFSLQRETAPDGPFTVVIDRIPPQAFRHVVTVHGDKAAGSVVRAIERDLSVKGIGASRWTVSGTLADLAGWLAVVYEKTADEVHAMFGWSPEFIASEDSPTPTVTVAKMPPVHVTVTLPDRKTSSSITRDRDGGIVNVIQLETSA